MGNLQQNIWLMSLKKSQNLHNAGILGILSKKYTFCMTTVLTLNKKDRLARGHV